MRGVPELWRAGCKRRRMWMKKSHSPVRGAVSGVIGGLFASWVMNQFQAGMKKVSSHFQQEDQGGDEWSAAQDWKEIHQVAGGEEEPATEKTAVAVAEGVFHHELGPEQKKSAGQLVHYVYGAAIGGLYGWAAENSETVRMGSGTVFGAAVWLAGDEIGVPAFGLSKKPQEYPIGTHASALAAHFVYGVTTEVVRRALRRGWLAS
jgi:hypothetical protein